MEVKIKYEDIIKRCEQLSSFEAEGKFDANGESRYLELHINKIDEQLIEMYIEQARAILEERMERMIVNADDLYKIIGQFDFIYTGVPDNEVDWLDGRSPVAYFTDGDAFAYYEETNNEVYDIQYINDGIWVDEIGVTKVYYNKSDRKLYTWHPTQEGLIEYLGEKGFTWVIRPDTRWNGLKTFTKHVNEAIVSYAMAQWFKGKLDDRVPFYENLFNNTLAMAVKNIFTKQAP